MKKILLFTFLSAVLFSFYQSEKENNSDKILTLAMVQNVLPNATDIKMTKDRSPYPTTFYKGKLDNQEFTCHITFLPDLGTPSNFDRMNKYNKDAEKVDNLGELAVYSPSKGQLSFMMKGNIYHVGAQIMPNKSMKEAAWKLAKKVEANELDK